MPSGYTACYLTVSVAIEYLQIYDMPESHLKLNDVFEFIGIYTFDPELAGHKDNSDDLMYDLFEDPMAHLPPSKVSQLIMFTLYIAYLTSWYELSSFGLASDRVSEVIDNWL